MLICSVLTCSRAGRKEGRRGQFGGESSVEGDSEGGPAEEGRQEGERNGEGSNDAGEEVQTVEEGAMMREGGMKRKGQQRRTHIAELLSGTLVLEELSLQGASLKFEAGDSLVSLATAASDSTDIDGQCQENHTQHQAPLLRHPGHSQENSLQSLFSRISYSFGHQCVGHRRTAAIDFANTVT